MFRSSCDPEIEHSFLSHVSVDYPDSVSLSISAVCFNKNVFCLSCCYVKSYILAGDRRIPVSGIRIVSSVEESDFSDCNIYVIYAVLIDARKQAFTLLITQLSSEVDRSSRCSVYKTSVHMAGVSLFTYDDNFARSVIYHILGSSSDGVDHILFGGLSHDYEVSSRFAYCSDDPDTCFTDS